MGATKPRGTAGIGSVQPRGAMGMKWPSKSRQTPEPWVSKGELPGKPRRVTPPRLKELHCQAKGSPINKPRGAPLPTVKPPHCWPPHCGDIKPPSRQVAELLSSNLTKQPSVHVFKSTEHQTAKLPSQAMLQWWASKPRGSKPATRSQASGSQAPCCDYSRFHFQHQIWPSTNSSQLLIAELTTRSSKE